MFTYQRIYKIKHEILDLIHILKSNPKYKKVLTLDEIKSFESEIPAYDHVLNKLDNLLMIMQIKVLEKQKL